MKPKPKFKVKYVDPRTNKLVEKFAHCYSLYGDELTVHFEEGLPLFVHWVEHKIWMSFNKVYLSCDGLVAMPLPAKEFRTVHVGIEDVSIDGL